MEIRSQESRRAESGSNIDGMAPIKTFGGSVESHRPVIDGIGFYL
jgi:hypothetical protein|tara:strand:+ start:343 stop:477 length:135 start_codon:yes stop_codon:yes gene_type:complete